ncbi:Mannonate dehydratase [Planctomycetes bacterium CA13]|uniref:mannonate dehydratase n=1 Tax=Novipirellula herctigrandis TaxID=2527986 RepID=A0A5C5Z436_9BACT|nr:Mannonate dehydratase [Planctomycetes bacterium CA13]
MKLGFGLYNHMLSRENYDFAVQCGATHVVVHLVNYFHQGSAEHNHDQPVGNVELGWGLAGGTPDEAWSVTSLKALKAEINDAGLELEAIENFDPAHWHDILLDGPQKEAQMERLMGIIRSVGEAGIPVFGYNFSLAGVAGRHSFTDARGGAKTVGMRGIDQINNTPVPNGMVWNMVYDPNAPVGELPQISHDELWRRLEWFLKELVPVAEQAGVRLAAHPDDPPLDYVRGQPRLVYQPDMYQRLLDIVPSHHNALEFCLGTLSEMTEGDINEVCERYVKQGDVAYIHFRNVRGKVPHYTETFIDEGQIDMRRIMEILKKNQFEGVIIPDHTPQMSCHAPWHAGMAFAMGYIKALQG